VEDLEGRLAPATFNLVAGVTDNQAGSLRAAILAANTNSSASNTINLAAGTYKLADAVDGNLLIKDAIQTVQSKTLTIAGKGETNTIVEGGSGWADRIFEIFSQTGATVKVVFKNFSIENGMASNAGLVGRTPWAAVC